MMSEWSLLERLRYLRTRVLHLTQLELARIAGVDGRTVRRWERGDRTPAEHVLRTLAELSDIDASWLIEGVGDPPPRRAAHAPAGATHDFNRLTSRIWWVRTQILHKTQAGFGEVVQVDVRTVRRWEQGDTRPPKRLLQALAEAIGIDAQWLLTGAGEPPRRAATGGEVTPGQRELSPQNIPVRGRGRLPFHSQRDMKRLLSRIGPAGHEPARKAAALKIYAELLRTADMDPPDWWPSIWEMVETGQI